jgi:ATP-dependent Clp protease adaptor protein ClpS
MSKSQGPREDSGVVVETRTERRLKRPRLYRVLLHNDDYTTMEFVVAILQSIFHHSEASASSIMLHIHRGGVGVAGVFTYEIAETKVGEVQKAAEEAEFPLLCTMEPEDDDDDGDGDDGGDRHDGDDEAKRR